MSAAGLLSKGFSVVRAAASRTERNYHVLVNGRKVGSVDMQHAGPRSPGWEVSNLFIEKEVRGSGLSRQAYDVIERDIRQKILPSGSLTDKGYRNWQKRNPDLVANHRRVDLQTLDGPYWLSPRQLIRERSELSRSLNRRSVRENIANGIINDRIRQKMSDRRVVSEALRSVPADALRPSALRRVFSVAGAGTVGWGAVASQNRNPLTPEEAHLRSVQAAMTRRLRGDFS